MTKFDTLETTLQQMEQELLKTNLEKARLEATLAAIGDGVRIMGRDFTILYQNQVDKNIVGDHSGEHCHKAFQRRDQACEGCHLSLCFQDGKIHKKDQLMMTEKGKQYNEITASPLRDSTGTIVAGIEIVRDITERRQREERLKKINAAILKLDEHDHPGNLNAMTVLCGQLLGADCALYNRLEGDLLCVRGQWAGPSDLQKEDSPQGHICFDVINRDSDIPLVVRNLGSTAYAKTDPNVAAYGLQTYIGCRVRYGATSRGSLCVVFTRDYEPSNDDLDMISIIASALAQEEERYAALEKLQRSEQFIRNILDTVDESFIVIDRNYRILTANNAYCSQASLPCNEVIGRHCHEVSHGTNRPCYEEGEDCAVRHVLATGEPHMVLHTHADKEGHLLYVETKAFPVKDAEGNITSAIETINNITEKHLLEDERLKTQKLESVGILAGGIAHDFNNLLQGIFGYISMARMTIDHKDNALSMLDQADNALQRSVNLTSQLLTFAKGGKPVKKLIDLGPVIENATKFTLSGSRSDFHMSIPEDLWEAEADEGQVGQVVQNIALNADQAMPLGGSVMVTAANVPEGDTSLPPRLARGNYVMISIRDTGIGIPQQFIGRIFDPYFTTKEKGSGLGLATSYSIVRNHGGMIDITTKSGEGSTFTIYLPAIAKKGRTASAAKPAEPSLQRAARVLVMDDEEIIRKLSIVLLGKLGHNVVVAKHGLETLKKYQAAMTAGKPFDIVILDLTIRGGMGGAETIQKLLKIDPAVKAIVSSGYSDDATIANHLSLGFKAYLKKPYNAGVLRDTLSSLLS